MSQFAFLKSDFPDLYKHASKAELHALSDPGGACFWARLTVETAVKWIYNYEQEHLSYHIKFYRINCII